MSQGKSAAISAAFSSNMKNRHGAAMVLGGKILSTGFNTIRSRVFRSTNHSTHAECQALNRLPKKYLRKIHRKLTVYIAQIGGLSGKLSEEIDKEGARGSTIPSLGLRPEANRPFQQEYIGNVQSKEQPSVCQLFKITSKV